MKNKLKKLSYWAGVGAVGIVLGLSLQFTRAWTEPGTEAPGGNLAAPINIGSGNQSKVGNVGFGNLAATTTSGIRTSGTYGMWSVGTSYAGVFQGSGNGNGVYTVGAGTGFDIYANGTKAYFRGNVGIGTTAPVSKLHLNAISSGIGTEVAKFCVNGGGCMNMVIRDGTDEYNNQVNCGAYSLSNCGWGDVWGCDGTQFAKYTCPAGVTQSCTDVWGTNGSWSKVDVRCYANEVKIESAKW